MLRKSSSCCELGVRLLNLMTVLQLWKYFAGMNDEQLLNWAAYDLKNYADLRECCPPRPPTSADNTLLGPPR